MAQLPAMASDMRGMAPKLPQNLDAERAVLGAVLLDNDYLNVALQHAQPGDLFHQHHQRIMGAMIRLAEAQQSIDLITLVEDLQRHNELEAAGGAAYIAQLMDGVPRVTNVEHYARIVKEKSVLRSMIRATDAIQQQALEAEDDAGAILDRACASLARIASDTAQQVKNTHTISLATADDFLKRTSADEKPWLAERLLPSASQTIWQGRPKVGKSHSLLQVAFDLACGLPVFGHFEVRRIVRCAYVELEEPEGITKARYAAMLRAHGGQGPDSQSLRFFTREDLHCLRLLPRELLAARLKDFIASLRDAGSELVILIALRKFVAPGENLKDQEVAERVNDALDAIRVQTGAATALANHDRKEPASTLEAQGFGSTFVSAGADGSFDLERGKDGLRRVRAEARFDTPEQFLLRKEPVGDGEVIRWTEAPPDPREAHRDELVRRVAAGESIRQAARAAGVSYSTAQRWVKESDEES